MSSGEKRKIFINGMSIGTGGGYTVGREVARGLAMARPDWQITLAVIQGHRLQKEFESEDLPSNIELLWTPQENASTRCRLRYEKRELTDLINSGGYEAVFQLNGMIIPGVKAPTFAHFQDPFPYRSEAWTTLRERINSWFKRRANRLAIQKAAVCGWTSNYLEGFVCGYHGIQPKRSIVFYNGVPDAWVERAAGELPAWESRPMKMVTVSNVWPYKRQSLVIEALALLRKMPGLEQLEYHILGAGEEAYQAELGRLAKQLGVGDAVHVEGRVSDQRVEEALAESRVMPLMSVCESFGIPMIEAMAYGTPVVAADCCALPEVCGEAALITPIDDVQALADTLNRLLTDPQLVEQQRRLGAERVAHFQWKTIGEQMAEAIDEMIAG